MHKLLLMLLVLVLVLVPVTAFAQTEYTLSDGSTMQAYVDIPDSAESDSVFPLVIILGGGPGDARIANSAFRSHGDAFIDRGWAVVAPVSPNGQSFWGANADKVRQLIAQIKQGEDIHSGPVLLMGVSNGGISSFDIASRHPQEYLGVIAVPALASDTAALSTLQDFPVYLRIGSEDRLGWGNRYDATVQVLHTVGVKLDARLLQGTGHTFPLNWSELEPWLAALH